LYRGFYAHLARFGTIDAKEHDFRTSQLLGNSIGQASQVSGQYDVVLDDQCCIQPISNYLPVHT